MPRQPDRHPGALSERSASIAAALIARGGLEVDLAVGGLPFRLATNPEMPQAVETVPVRKEQFDSEVDPGEQSLSFWWRRSQDSWHEGAGSLYQESRGDTTVSSGFYASTGIDVWTKGELSLLPLMVDRADTLVTRKRVGTFATNGTRTNLCTNPSLESNTTGWTGAGYGETAPTLTRDTGKFHSGAASLKVVSNGDDGASFPPAALAPSFSVTAGHSYTISAWVWVDSTVTSPVAIFPTGISLFDFAASQNSGSTKGAWVQVFVTWVAPSTGTQDVHFSSSNGAFPTNAFYHVDDVLYEESPSVQPYFDGNSVNGAWTGTVNNSTSTFTIVSSTAKISAVSSASLWTKDTPTAAFAALHTPAGKTLVDGFCSGLYFYDVATDGTLYQGLQSSPGTATTWPLTGGQIPYRMLFGKHRLWVIGGRSIWQPDLTDAGGTNQPPIFTHPNQGWQYTSMAEGPSAMYFAGHDGRTSSIQAITLDAGGGLPTLSGASATAIFPDGELVQEIAVLAGQFIGIGTNKGFRVGTLSSDGGISYGPILFTPEGATACTSIMTEDRFFRVAFRTAARNAETYKVDTGTALSEGVYPYASDLTCDQVESVESMVNWTDFTLMILSNGSFWSEAVGTLCATGWLQTGRIRFRTTERKIFKNLQLETQPMDGQIQVVGFEETGTEFAVGTANIDGEAGASFGLPSELGPQRQMSFKFTLVRDAGDSTDGPVINSYMLRALPSIKPQREYTLPLLCYDRETARSGQEYGQENFGAERLAALQELEDLGDLVIFQDFSLPTPVGQSCVITSVQYIQTVPSQIASGKGGIIVLKLRTAEI